MPVIFVFVDGVGIGRRDPAVNPLALREYLLSHFTDGGGTALPRGGRVGHVDACLGVPGRPQSATGQTTILTGQNAARVVGRHLLGFPNAPLRDLLQRHSLFRQLAAAGRTGTFANAYPVAYLRAIGMQCDGEPEFALPTRRRPRASATTVAFSAGGGTFRTWSDARDGRGLTHDITAQRARALGADVQLRSPSGAAEILLDIARRNDLTLFEFYETDEAGHARGMERASEVLDRLDGFLRAVLAALPDGWSLVVASDHGNLEDLSTRNHTRSSVPLLGFGPAADRVADVEDLTGLLPLLLRLAGLRPASIEVA